MALRVAGQADGPVRLTVWLLRNCLDGRLVVHETLAATMKVDACLMNVLRYIRTGWEGGEGGVAEFSQIDLVGSSRPGTGCQSKPVL